jgi:hypothetical protein
LKQWAAQTGDADAAVAARAALLLRANPELGKELLANPGFEPDGPRWNTWVRPDTSGKVAFSADAARSGKAGAVIRSAAAACVMQTLPAKPGEMYLATIHIRGSAGAKGIASLVIKFKDAAGKWLPDSAGCSTMVPAAAAVDWTRLAVVARVPKGSATLVWMASAKDQGDDETIQFDTASLKRVPQ